jgi:molybdenum cofactor cytidylyltransferase
VAVGVLLLAAGFGRRFGSDKRFAKLPDGRTVLAATLDAIEASELPLLVCLRPEDEDTHRLLQRRAINTVTCPRASEGMGGSLAQGAAAIPSAWSGVLVALADMPWIQPQSYRRIATAVTSATICVPYYQQQRGHPVAFGSEYFAALQQCAGDVGARAVLQQHKSACRPLALEDPGILRDVDLPADLLVT